MTKTKNRFPKATIIITNKETGLISRTRTDTNGRYVKKALPPGDYTIEVFAGDNYETGNVQFLFFAD